MTTPADHTTTPLLAGFTCFAVAVIVGAIAGYRWAVRGE